ncbi:hypothetical protein ACEZ3G_16445 [Maribacter algicola]|uniref:Uncharacterized protein n=1 Tax=Meishania litoralis TaxID=3434685 RepID=A0ACC7LNH0_9FLAO
MFFGEFQVLFRACTEHVKVLLAMADRCMRLFARAIPMVFTFPSPMNYVRESNTVTGDLLPNHSYAISLYFRKFRRTAHGPSTAGHCNKPESEITLDKNMRQLPILFLTIILFSSCEKETFVIYSVENQSSSFIRIVGSDIINSFSIDETIEQNKKKDVANWSKLGKETDYFEPTSMFGDNLIITNASGDTLTKDYRLLSNWTSDVDNQRAVANHGYILVITDADF